MSGKSDASKPTATDSLHPTRATVDSDSLKIKTMQPLPVPWLPNHPFHRGVSP